MDIFRQVPLLERLSNMKRREEQTRERLTAPSPLSALSENQTLRLQILLRDIELLNVRSRDLLLEFRETLQPAPNETLFDPAIMRFRVSTEP